MATPDTVSVVIPCFNGKEYLDDAILSVRNQTYSALDIIVVDDGSTDETPRLLELHVACDPRVRLVSQPNRGVSAARNAGLRQARGEFVSLLDQDDVLLPDKIERQVQYLRNNPAIDLVYSDYFVGDSRLELTGLYAIRMPGGDSLEAYACRNWFAPMVALVRRSMIERVGEFDETLCGVDDWDYWMRCAMAGTFGYLPGPVAIYRTHPSQAHNDTAMMFNGGKRVINKHFRSDPRQYRLAMTAFYEAYAKSAWARQQRLKAGLYVALSTYHDTIRRLRKSCSRGFVRPDAGAGRLASPRVKV